MVTIACNSAELIDIVSDIICIVDIPEPSRFTPPHCRDDFTTSVFRRRLYVMDQVGYAVEKFTYIFKRVPTTFADFMVLNDFLMNIVSHRRTTYPDLYITYITEVVGIFFGLL